MSLAITGRGKIKKIEVKDKSTTVLLQTSRKKTDYQKNFESQRKKDAGIADPKIWDYANSDWFLTFVGEAHEAMSLGDFKETDVITVQGSISREPYFSKEEGKDVYPKSSQMTVFKVELYRAGTGKQTKPQVEESAVNEEDIPF